jgi:hypothetical protein
MRRESAATASTWDARVSFKWATALSAEASVIARDSAATMASSARSARKPSTSSNWLTPG